MALGASRTNAARRVASTLLTASVVVGSVLVTATSASASRSSTSSVPRARGGRRAGSVASVLRPDGSIRTGRSGSFDAHGYRLTLGAHGAPHLVRESRPAPAGRANPADVSWDDRFGEPGVQNDINASAVNAVAVDGTDVYVGGIFTFAGGARHSYVLRWDGRAWNDLSGGVRGAPSGESPEVDALALSGDTLYVGGIFNQVVNGSTGVTANDVAAWNTQTNTWSSLGTGISAGSSCDFCFVRVEALAASGSTLFAAGSFGRAGGTDVNSIAQWNGSSWSALGDGLWSCDACEPVQPGDVRALVLSGSTLYAGGIFEEAGTVVANNVAQWSTGTSTWSALGTGISGFFSAEVDALATSGTTLIAGGDFTQAGSANVNSLAKWTGSAWQSLDGANSGVTKSGEEGMVGALLVDGSTLFVGGAFDHLQPGSTPAKGGLASFNLSSPGWTVLPMEQAPATVNVFAPNPGGGVYVGGSFDTGGPLATALLVDDIGVLNGTTWSTLGQGVTFGENGHGSGLALAHGSTGEYAGGWFNQTGPVKTKGIARWDGSAWHAMGSGIAGGSGPTGPMVFAIAVVGQQVFIGGDFDSVSGVSAHNIAVYSGGHWHAVGGGTDGIVQALASSNGYLYVGGDFTKAGGKLVGAPVARWKLGTSFSSGAGWTKLGPVFGSGGVTAIAFAGPWVILGGDLGHCEPGSPCDHGGTGHDTAPCEAQSGFSINGLIMWKTTTPNTWYAPFGCGVTVGVGPSAAPGDVKTMRKVGTTLYVGGFFDHAGVLGKSPNQIAAMNVVSLDLSVLNKTKTVWHALKTGVGNDTNGDSVASLSSAGGALYVGGDFLKGGGLTSHGVARWNIGSSTWSPLGSGLACPDNTCSGVYASAVDAGAAGIYFAGNFGTAGGTGSDNIALWHPPA